MAELVEALSFFLCGDEEKRQGFDKLSHTKPDVTTDCNGDR
jgi:hypothetical protein